MSPVAIELPAVSGSSSCCPSHPNTPLESTVILLTPPRAPRSAAPTMANRVDFARQGLENTDDSERRRTPCKSCSAKISTERARTLRGLRGFGTGQEALGRWPVAELRPSRSILYGPIFSLEKMNSEGGGKKRFLLRGNRTQKRLSQLQGSEGDALMSERVSLLSPRPPCLESLPRLIHKYSRLPGKACLEHLRSSLNWRTGFLLGFGKANCPRTMRERKVRPPTPYSVRESLADAALMTNFRSPRGILRTHHFIPYIDPQDSALRGILTDDRVGAACRLDDRVFLSR